MTRKSFTPKPPAAGRNKFDNPKGTTVSIKGYKPDYIIIDDPAADSSKGSTATEAMQKAKENWHYWKTDAYARMAESIYAWPSPTGRTTADSNPKSDAERAYAAARREVEKYLHKATAHTTGWDDVIGNERARTALLEAIEHPHQYKAVHAHYGIKAPKGVLLYGPPGCGKTMFAKATASAMARLHGADTELLIINGAEIQSGYVSETERTIREIFAFARAYHAFKGHPLVVFVDEADAILPDRNRGYRFEASNVATFLTEMDGMAATGAFVILASNRPDAIDEAVLRDGRIDRRIKVERPTYDDALAIATAAMLATPVHDGTPAQLTEALFNPSHLLRPLTNHVTGNVHHFLLSHIVSGAMVVGLVERAKGIAMRRDVAAGTLTGITSADLQQAVADAFVEAKGLEHDYALREFVETVAIPFEQARQRQTMN